MRKYDKSFVLVGMMGSGKTSIGALLAEVTYLPFFDNDKLIEEKLNLPISDVFKHKGEEFFRAQETDIISDTLKQKSPCVLSSGGGAFIQKSVRAVCKQYAVTVFLDVPFDDLWQRVKYSNRPLVQAGYHAFADLWKVRYATYATADMTIACQDKTPEEIVADILA